MKSRENLVRLKQFRVNEKRRQLLQLDMMIAEFERMAVELELQITAEEKKAGITDINHFAYPTFAKAARLRRDNLRNSQSDLAQQRSAAKSLLGEAEAELSKAEMLEFTRHQDSRSRNRRPQCDDRLKPGLSVASALATQAGAVSRRQSWPKVTKSSIEQT